MDKRPDTETSGVSTLRASAADQVGAMLAADPFLAAFHDGSHIDAGFYRRNLIEDVLRIRMNNTVDAKCLHLLLGCGLEEDAGLLLRYLAEEYGHHRMLMADLEELGVSEEAVIGTKPLRSTELLMAYISSSIEKDGFLPDLVWNWFVEWYSATFNGDITQGAEVALGADAVRHTSEHLVIDQSLKHESRMEEHLDSLVRDDAVLNRALEYLQAYVDLIRRFYDELKVATGIEQ